MHGLARHEPRGALPRAPRGRSKRSAARRPLIAFGPHRVPARSRDPPEGLLHAREDERDGSMVRGRARDAAASAEPSRARRRRGGCGKCGAPYSPTRGVRRGWVRSREGVHHRRRRRRGGGSGGRGGENSGDGVERRHEQTDAGAARDVRGDGRGGAPPGNVRRVLGGDPGDHRARRPRPEHVRVQLHHRRHRRARLRHRRHPNNGGGDRERRARPPDRRARVGRAHGRRQEHHRLRRHRRRVRRHLQPHHRALPRRGRQRRGRGQHRRPLRERVHANQGAGGSRGVPHRRVGRGVPSRARRQDADVSRLARGEL